MRKSTNDSFSPNCSGRCHKVDYPDFDIKLRESLLCTTFFLNTYSSDTSCNSFFYFILNVKSWHFDIHFTDITSKVQQWRHLTPPPTFRSVSLLFQTTHGQEKSRQVMVRSLAWCQSGFQLVSGLQPYILQGMAGPVGSALSFILSFLLSKWIDGTTVFWTDSWNHLRSTTHLANTGRGKVTPCESEVKTERTPVLDSYPRVNTDKVHVHLIPNTALKPTMYKVS